MSPRLPRDERTAAGLGGRFYGVFPAKVLDIVDQDGQGRVQVELPWTEDPGGGEGYRVWARLATLMAGGDRGTWFIPDVDDEVLVSFEAGDPRRPYVVGCLWNGVDAPPESMDGAGNNYLKVIHSRNGVKIVLDDTDGAETLTLETPAGQSLVIHDGEMSIVATDVSGNTIKMEPSGITLSTPSEVKVEASTVKVTAAMVTVDAPMAKFSGVVKCETLITNSVISPLYTPGAGNIW